jgi:hypothetical protein
MTGETLGSKTRCRHQERRKFGLRAPLYCGIDDRQQALADKVKNVEKWETHDDYEMLGDECRDTSLPNPMYHTIYPSSISKQHTILSRAEQGLNVAKAGIPDMRIGSADQSGQTKSVMHHCRLATRSTS